MLHDLGRQSLDGRRQDQRLVLFYKIINGGSHCLSDVNINELFTMVEDDSITRRH